MEDMNGFETNAIYKIVKKYVKNMAHVRFLKRCLLAGFTPKGIMINRNRYHVDLTPEIEKMDIALAKAEIGRLEVEINREKNQILEEESKQTETMDDREKEEYKKRLRKQIKGFQSRYISTLNRMKNKKFNALNDAFKNKDEKNDYETESFVGEFLVWAEVTPKKHRRKLSTKSRKMIKQAKARFKRRQAVTRNEHANDVSEEESDAARKPFTGHIGTGRVKNISDEEIPESVEAFLSLGPKFCPTPPEVDIYGLKKDLWEAERRCRLRLWFADQDDQRSEEEIRFYLNRKWTPPPKTFPECDIFWKRINEKLDKWTPPKRIRSNLTPLENKGKKFVQNDTTHVYKVEDKGSSICRIKLGWYENNVIQNLNNNNIYEEIDYRAQVISGDTKHNLMISFYLIFKITNC